MVCFYVPHPRFRSLLQNTKTFVQKSYEESGALRQYNSVKYEFIICRRNETARKIRSVFKRLEILIN